MTVASEITRLQWAKASAKASIENKWVTVPANATVDTYHNYIDQIQQWWAILSWLKLYNNCVSNIDDTPQIMGLVSFEKNGVYYWCCISSLEAYSSSGNSTYNYALYNWKKVNGSDVSYQYSSISWPWIYIGSQRWSSDFYINWNLVRVYFYEYESVSGGNYTYWVYKFDWNLSTNSCTAVRVGSSKNPTELYDIDWYSELTWSTWVQSATWNEINDDAYIYLTLK